jgi:dihydroxyacetone kinase
MQSIFLNALAQALRVEADPAPIAASSWAEALHSALERLAKYTPAQPGDRTLIDALKPFVETFTETKNIAKAAQAAREGAERTRGMQAKLGRTVYVGGDGYKEVPDPGAFGLSIFLSGLAEGL